MNWRGVDVSAESLWKHRRTISMGFICSVSFLLAITHVLSGGGNQKDELEWPVMNPMVGTEGVNPEFLNLMSPGIRINEPEFQEGSMKPLPPHVQYAPRYRAVDDNSARPFAWYGYESP